MAWKCISFSIKHWVFLCLVYIITLDGSTSKLLSVTRSEARGDSFEVHLENNSVCHASSCEQYGGFLGKANQKGSNTGKCSCFCGNLTKPTFYSTRTGQQSCVKDVEVLEDRNGDICDFYTDNAQQLEVLNLNAGGKTRMKPDGVCEDVRVSGWRFYFNSSWTLSTSDTFSISHRGNNGSGKKHLQTFLTWNGNIGPFYKGLLIKVKIRCTYRGTTDDRCVMLKAQGTHVYHEFPANSPTWPPIYDSSSSSTQLPTVSSKEKNKSDQTKTKALLGATDFGPASPTGGYSKASTRQIWLVVSLGLSALLFIVIIGIAGCLVVKCRSNCRKRQRTGSRHHLQVPVERSQSRTEECPAMHDYEYVHYPCLVEGGRTPPVTPVGNRKYERGQDNKLIIWTQGRNPAPNQNNQSTAATAPRLPYQRLLTRTSSSSPDCNMGVRLASSAAVEEALPYQKLVRAVPPLGSKQECGQAEEAAAVGPQYDEAIQKQYQTLSLTRNPLASPKEDDTGYMRMEGAPRPESTLDYDYANPVELNKLFRISNGEGEHVSMVISIGDLGEASSNPQQQQQHHDEVRSSVISSDENYEDVENIDVRNSLPSAVENDESLKPKALASVTSYENLSGGCTGHLSGRCMDPEEYVEMGKRRSMLIEDNPDQSGCHGFAKIEEEGHEYFVLEGTSEGKTVHDS